MLIQRYKELMFSLQEKITNPNVFLNMSNVMTQLFIEHEAQLMLDAGVDKEEIYKQLPSLKGRDLEDIGYISLQWHIERREDFLINSLGQKFFAIDGDPDIEWASRSSNLGIAINLTRGYIDHLLGRRVTQLPVSVKADHSFTKTMTKLQVAELAYTYHWEGYPDGSTS